MTLDKTIKDKLKTYFDDKAEAHEISVENFEDVFEKHYEKIAVSPAMKGKSEIKVIKQVKAKVASYFRNVKKNGKRVIFIPFCNMGKPKDWNEGDLKEIKAYVESGKVAELVTAGKCMYMFESSKKVPVSSQSPVEYGKKKVYVKGNDIYLDPEDGSEEIEEWFVLKGKALKPGETSIIPRDNRIKSGKSSFLNFNYSRPLLPKYETHITGIAFVEGDEEDVRMFDMKVKGDAGNPHHKEFVLSSLEMFRPYVGEFAVTEINNGMFKLDYVGKFSVKPTEITGVTKNNIDDVIEANLTEIKDKHGSEVFVPEVIYLDQLEDYHEKTMCMRDDAGKILKTPSGWDRTHWNSYGILLSDLVKGIYPKPDEDKSNMYRFGDGDVDRTFGAFGQKWLSRTTAIKNETPVMAAIKTSRSPFRYDFKTKKKVLDPKNADINIDVLTIKELPRVEEIEIEFEEDEDT